MDKDVKRKLKMHIEWLWENVFNNIILKYLNLLSQKFNENK